MKHKSLKFYPVLALALVLLLALTGTVGAQEGRTGETKDSSALSLQSVSVDDTLTAAQLAGLLVGTGSTAPTITNVSYTGDSRGSGSFSGGTGIVGFESGVILGSGRVIDVVGPNTSDATTTAFGVPGDSDLNGLIPGYTTYDATVLEFDFECPAGTGGAEVISFSYVFTSEEYNEFVNSPFNDVFGFFLNGTNIALLPDGVTPVSINNVNNGYSAGGGLPGTNPSNPAYYINNDLSDGGPFVDIEADGLTVVLGAQANINPGVANHMKLAIADAGDQVLDSWVFIKAGSFVCAPLNQPPVADANGPYSGNEGSPISLDGTGSDDPDVGDTLTYAWSVDSTLCTFDDATSATPNLTCTDNGNFNVTLVVDDGQATDSDTAAVTVANVAPTVSIDSVAPTLVAVGESVVADGSFTDPGTNDTHTALWNWGDGTSAGTVSVLDVGPDSHSYGAAGIYTIQLTVTDDDGGVGTAEYMYVVVYDPSAGFVTGGGWIDSPAGAYYPASLPFFDGSYYQLVDAPFISWDDANAAANAMTLVGCAYPHLVTITSQEEQDFLYGEFGADLAEKWYGGFDTTVSSPSEGWQWVTGEPWSYTNWYVGEPNNGYPNQPYLQGWPNWDPDRGKYWDDNGWPTVGGPTTGYIVEYDDCFLPTGKANFGFVSKYQKGANKPTGNTEFQFHAAGLNFHSSSYEWLVVTGGDYAMFKGVGTINGEGAYKFMLWAGDGTGTEGADTFRIRIWEEDEMTAVETDIYDNGMDQDIGGGSIVVHSKK